MASNKKRKLKLWSENPHCHWCGCLTVLANTHVENQATVDHLYSRYNPARYLDRGHDEPTTVLACYKCNHERGVKETASRPREELYLRGKGLHWKPSIFGKKKCSSVEEVIAICEYHDRIMA